MAGTDGLAWLLLCSALVMLMQAGFLCLETGLTRSKNNINVAMKNLADLGLSLIIYWLVGYGLMFGTSNGGWFGSDGWAMDLATSAPSMAAFLLFQALFCGTAVTIMSGAVAERLAFAGYLALTVVLTAVVYPVLGHWAWNEDGWLAAAGFVDFAGATVVHSTGGWAGLAIIMVLGARRGRFDGPKPDAPLTGSDLPFTTLGALFLWIGWVGFNGGSLLTFDERVVSIIATTAFGGAAGLLTALTAGWIRAGIPRVTDSINGLLGGLVSVTASAPALSTRSAIVVGAIGALFTLALDRELVRRRIDDAVGAVPVHLGGGVWGTIAVALFADLSILGTGNSRLAQLGVQALGVVVIAAWVFGVVRIATWLIERRWSLRVSAEAEQLGLNVAEHGASTDLVELFDTLAQHESSGDSSLRVPSDSSSNVGQLGNQFNRVMDALETSEADLTATQRLAHRDPLTETLNRRGLTRLLEDHEGSERTVLMFDVVRFGSINGSLGYSAGDEVLTQMTVHLSNRLGRHWSMGRWGGDEFVAVAHRTIEVDPDTLERIVCSLDSGGQVTISVRVGVFHAPPGLPVDNIIHRASYALDEAKRTGVAMANFAGPLAQRYERSREIAARAKGSLAEQVRPVGQTIVSHDAVIGVELLARWHNDDGTIAPPGDFLPVVMQSGRMYEFDLHMIDQGIDFAQRLNHDGPGPWVSVNVTAPSFAAPGIVTHIESRLADSGLEPDRLVIEITEMEPLESNDHWLQNARQLRSLGVGLAVDDFGSGYSGIQRVDQLPITHLKFDRGLITSADGPLAGIVKSVADLALASGVVPIAEGVETVEQLETIRNLGIDVIQGFLFSRPTPLSEIEAALRGQQVPS